MSEREYKHHIQNDTVHVDYIFFPGSVVEMNVSITPTASSAAYHRALKDVKKEVSLPGFRKGKIPEDLLQKHFAEHVEHCFEEVIFSVAFREASALINRPLFSKRIRKAKKKKLSHDGVSEVFFQYEATPQVPKVDLSQLNVRYVPTQEPSQQEVDVVLLRLRFGWSERALAPERAIQENDAALLSLWTTVDGVERLVEDEKELLISKVLFPEWLFIAILGMKEGENRTVPHPDEKNSDGTPAQCTIKVKTVSTCTLIPEDDAFASMWGLPSKNELRDLLTNQLRGEYRAQAQEKMRRSLRNELIRLYAFDLPQTLVEAETERRFRSYVQTLSSPEKIDKDAERKRFLDTVKRYFTCFFILEQFLPAVDQSITQEQLTQELTLQRQLPPAQRVITSDMEEKEAISRLAISCILRRVEDYLLQKILPGSSPQEEEKSAAESLPAEENVAKEEKVLAE